MGKGKVLTKKDAEFLKQEFKSVFATKENLKILKKEIANRVTRSVVPQVTRSVVPEVTRSVVPEVAKAVVPEIAKAVVPEVTQAVIPQIKSVVKLVISGELTEQEEKYEKKLEEFKSEFFDKVDLILKEITTVQEERPLIESRLEALEKIHPQGKHVLSS